MQRSDEMPLELLALAQKEGIRIEWWNFSPPLEAIYWDIPGLPPIISLSYVLRQSPGAYFRCVLAEELGHHFTTTGNALPHNFFSIKNRLEVANAEYQALRWAALYLIPEEQLAAALTGGITERKQLAAWFRVTEAMLEFRLKLIRDNA